MDELKKLDWTKRLMNTLQVNLAKCVVSTALSVSLQHEKIGEALKNGLTQAIFSTITDFSLQEVDILASLKQIPLETQRVVSAALIGSVSALKGESPLISALSAYLSDRIAHMLTSESDINPNIYAGPPTQNAL